MWKIPDAMRTCPFCGSSGRFGVTITPGIHVIQCGTCGAQGPQGRTPEDAECHWQTRGHPVSRHCAWCWTPFVPRAFRHWYCQAPCARKARQLTHTGTPRTKRRARRLRQQQQVLFDAYRARHRA